MVICNIIVERKTELTESLPSFVNVCDKHWKVMDKLPTLIYGYRLAKELYPNDLKVGQLYLRQLIQWSYTEEEMQSECWLNDFIDESVAKHLQCSEHSIDVLFDHRNFDIGSFISGLSEFPLVHAGAHEIYVAEKRESQVIVHSFQMDNLRYAEIDPEAFFIQLVSELDSQCILFSTDEFMESMFAKPPLSFQDLLLAKNGTEITFKEIITTFSPHVNEFKKEMLLAYVLRHPLYSPTLFKHFI